MSSYRSYVPWKSVNSTSSYSPKSETSSRYSSRDDITSPDYKSATSSASSSVRFGSLASPSSYRPSYSGGTYRSIKRDPPASTASTTSSSATASPYTSRYSSISSTLAGSGATKDAKDKDADTAKKSTTGSSTTPLNKYRMRTSSTSASTNGTDSAPKRYTGSTTTLSVKPSSLGGLKSRDPSPSGYLSVRTRDALKSRDTSPTTPVNYAAAERSRDPSPATDKFSSYRLNLRTNTTADASVAKRATTPATAGIALSYLTASDATARCVSRRTKREEEKSTAAATVETNGSDANDPLDADHQQQDDASSSADPPEMVEVHVVTRGTSPNPPVVQSASSYVRSRRTEVAKTIEKTIYRPAIRPQTTDREIQSDRMDDSTKYLRFGSTRISPWSYPESKYSSSANGYQSSRYSNGTKVSPPRTENAPIADETSAKPPKSKESPPKVTPLARSNSIKSNSGRFESAKQKSKSPIKSSSSGSTSTPTTTKKSLENGTSSTRALPPHAPKTELSPTKTVSSSTGSFKWTNKDFRKSALNVGPTDRPRKLTAVATTPSGGSAPSSPLMKRSERSVSTSSSEGSSSSSCSASSSSAATRTQPTKTSTSEEEEDRDRKSSTQSSSMVTASSGETTTSKDHCTTTMPNIGKLRLSDEEDDDDDDDDEEGTMDVTSSKPVANAAEHRTTKSFLSRAFEPVTNLFKSKSHQRSPTPVDTEATSYCVDDLHSASSSSNAESLSPDKTRRTSESTDATDATTNDVGVKIGHRLRHIDSGETAAWWDNNDNVDEGDDDTTTADDNDDTIADDMTMNSSIEPAPPPPPVPNVAPAVQPFFRITRIESGEKAWWMEDSPSKEESPKPKATPPPPSMPYRIRPIESGERAWWMADNNDSDSQPSETAAAAATATVPSATPAESVDTTATFTLRRNTTQSPSASSEKGWWMRSDNDDSGRATSEMSTATQPPPAPLSSQRSSPPVVRLENNGSPQRRIFLPLRLQHADSGELPWWMQSNDDESSEAATSATVALPATNVSPETIIVEDVKPIVPAVATAPRSRPTSSAFFDIDQLQELGDRASPEGVEDPALLQTLTRRPRTLFISRHTNIDDLLGGGCHQLSPLMDDRRFEASPTAAASALRSPTPTADFDLGKSARDSSRSTMSNGLDDAALQVYKDGDFGSYLDLESSLVEQSDEVDGLHASRKNSLVVRTQLSVRVHAIIEKLLTTQGRDLRRALFSLKQIFQEDKDLVHGFVALGGLNCLVTVGNDADQNYQNYILRAMGQVMLYVDGMNGVMRHEPSIRWLYSLIASKFRLVVKTALKLLLVFVEYVEGNSMLLVNAVHAEDGAFERTPWTNIMNLLKDYDNADTELLIYASTLINKTLSGLSDQDGFYDESDYLEQQGMEGVVQRYMSRPGTDLDLLDQLQLYEAVLKFEDGESDGVRIPDNSVRKTLRQRTPATTTNSNDTTPQQAPAYGERRKSRRHSTGTSLAPLLLLPPPIPPHPKGYAPSATLLLIQQTVDEDSSSSGSNSMEPTSPGEGSGGVGGSSIAGAAAAGGSLKASSSATAVGAGVTPGLRRRRERAERQKTFMREQQDASARALDASREEAASNHGQIVTAIPVRLQNIADATEPSAPPALPTSNAPQRPTVLDFTTTPSRPNGRLSKYSIDVPDKPPASSPSAKTIDHNANVFAGCNGSSTPTTASSSPLSLSSTTNKLRLPNSLGPTIGGSASNEDVPPAATPPPRSTATDTRHQNGRQCDNQKDFYASYSNTNATIQSSGLSNQQQPQQHQPQQSQQPHSPTIDALAKSTALKDLTIVSPRTSAAARRHNRRFSQKISGQDIIVSVEELQRATRSQQTHSTALNNQSSPTLESRNDADIATSDYLTDEHDDCGDSESKSSNDTGESEEKRLLLQLKRDHTVKDLTQKLSNLPLSPPATGPGAGGPPLGIDGVDKSQPSAAAAQRNMLIGHELTGLLSKAKEGLEKSKSKGEITRSASIDQSSMGGADLAGAMGLKKSEPKKSENELHWEELVSNMARPLQLCDLDFTDLQSDDDRDELAPRGLAGLIPPPPPPSMMMMAGGPPAPANLMGPPPPLMNLRASPLVMNGAPMNGAATTAAATAENGGTVKTKKTVKLFWKEVREDCMPTVSANKTIWDELPEASVDVEKLEHLFESRAKDLISKKQQELNKNKEIIVLDNKRSNAINIAMTKLPPPRAIKAAILKMDATVVTREGIEKLQNMLPTDEERGKIQEAQVNSPELPLGSAEQFLLTLSSISELAARLELWAFKLDFENNEKEIAEPLMDLKQGVQALQANRTFRCILATLRSIGIFLNGAPVKGFQIEYLAKVPEVKDTVHKHSLLHHLCHMVMENAPDTTDLYSELGAVTRTSKTDFADLAHQITSLETECKASWDRLKLIAKHDCAPQLKQRLVDFLADCAERIILLGIIHRRVLNRYRKFLVWLGVPQHRILESRPNEVCRIVSEFALEYRTTRERVQQQIEKKANHRERNKTRGKMIIDVDRFRTKEDKADAELRHILGSPGAVSPTMLKNAIESPTTITWPRRRSDQLRSPSTTGGGAMTLLRHHQHNPHGRSGCSTPVVGDDHGFADGDDEILESLVKTATKTTGSRPATRERKRTRHADRKSLRRTLKNGISEEERQTLAAFMTK